PVESLDRLECTRPFRAQEKTLDVSGDGGGLTLPERGSLARQPGPYHRGELDGVSVLPPPTRHRGQGLITQGSGERHVRGQHRRADAVRRPDVPQRAPVLPHLAAVALHVLDWQVEILPAPQVEAIRRVLDPARRDPPRRGTLHEPEQRRPEEQRTAVGGIDPLRPYGARGPHGCARIVLVRRAVVRDLEPDPAAVRGLPHPASSREGTRNMPRPDGEVAS